jgi:hypothetical protein
MNEAQHSPILPVQEVDTHEEAEAIRDATVATQMAGLVREQTTVKGDLAPYVRKDQGKELPIEEIYLDGLENKMGATGDYKSLITYLTELSNTSLIDRDTPEIDPLCTYAGLYLGELQRAATTIEKSIKANPYQTDVRGYIEQIIKLQHNKPEKFTFTDKLMNTFVDALAQHAAEVAQEAIVRRKVVQTGLHRDEFAAQKAEPIGEMDTTPGKDPHDGEEAARPEPIGDMDTDPDAESDMTHFEVEATKPLKIFPPPMTIAT